MTMIKGFMFLALVKMVIRFNMNGLEKCTNDILSAVVEKFPNARSYFPLAVSSIAFV